jgi:hypothetical protein
MHKNQKISQPKVLEIEITAAQKCHCDECDEVIENEYSNADSISMYKKGKDGYKTNHTFCGAKCASKHLGK